MSAIMLASASKFILFQASEPPSSVPPSPSVAPGWRSWRVPPRGLNGLGDDTRPPLLTATGLRRRMLARPRGLGELALRPWRSRSVCRLGLPATGVASWSTGLRAPARSPAWTTPRGVDRVPPPVEAADGTGDDGLLREDDGDRPRLVRRLFLAPRLEARDVAEAVLPAPVRPRRACLGLGLPRPLDAMAVHRRRWPVHTGVEVRSSYQRRDHTDSPTHLSDTAHRP